MNKVQRNLITKLKFSAFINDTENVKSFYNKFYDYSNMFPKDAEVLKEVNKIYVNYQLKGSIKQNE